MFPIRLGSAAEFAALRDSLVACNYTEAAICKCFGIARVSELLAAADFDTGDDATGPLRILVRLFIGSYSVNRRSCANLPLSELDALGLISIGDEAIVPTVMIYPTRGLYIVSDRRLRTGKDEPPPSGDVVYPAIVPNTDVFLDHIPPANCDAFLDLCAGTGIAALVAGRNGAGHAWAFDITARSTHFAEFNRHLNDVSNVTAVEGDLYEPAGDQTFDRIVAHPPYLPVYRPHFVFDSGGQDGEQIVRRIVEGLPRYLRPGGRFYALTMGSDRDQPFENRIRGWLGPEADDFDIAFVVRRALSPRDYVADAVVSHRGSVDDITGWRELFNQWNVQSLVYGLVVIQRRAGLRPIFTIRREVNQRSGPAECAWLIESATSLCNADMLLNAKPRTGSNAHLLVDHVISNGKWQAESYRLESSYPFNATMRVEPWAAHLLTIADGSQTTSDLLQQLISEDWLRPNVQPLEFASAVAPMIVAGFLELPYLKLPDAVPMGSSTLPESADHP